MLLDDSIRKWVCRLEFNTANKYIQLNDEEKATYKLNNVNEISLYKDEIIEVAKQFQYIYNKNKAGKQNNLLTCLLVYL
ncbi:hypothetical protein PMEGAPL128_11240 [Priestia megaterium]